MNQYHLLPSSSEKFNPTPESLLSLLRSHLPHSLPLYRRLQSGNFLPSSYILTNLPLHVLFNAQNTTAGKQHDEPWILALIDRGVRPETELLMFASWEGPSWRDHEEENSEKAKDELILQLARKIKQLEIPVSIHDNSSSSSSSASSSSATTTNREEEQEEVTDHSGVPRSAYANHLLNPNLVLCGAVHEASVPVLQRANLIAQAEPLVGLVSNHMYVFDLEARLPSARDELPAGLRWGELEPRHFGLVKSRTAIPRQDRTLAVLPRVGIFLADEDVPIAWAFTGLDGSLSTLHVEEKWRGKGLAKAVTVKLFTEKMDFLWEEGVPRVAHGYVINGNLASCGVCESLGGKAEWTVYWVRMDLGKLDG